MDTNTAILYVEDDPFSREVMQLMLVRWMKFNNVTIFDTSDDFMDRLQTLQQKPRLIFLDIHMQPHDGFTLLTMLRSSETYRDAKIVALTASVMNEEVEQLREAGFDGVMAKPLDQESFPENLNRVLKGERVWNVT